VASSSGSRLAYTHHIIVKLQLHLATYPPQQRNRHPCFNQNSPQHRKCAPTHSQTCKPPTIQPRRDIKLALEQLSKHVYNPSHALQISTIVKLRKIHVHKLLLLWITHGSTIHPRHHYLYFHYFLHPSLGSPSSCSCFPHLNTAPSCMQLQPSPLSCTNSPHA